MKKTLRGISIVVLICFVGSSIQSCGYRWGIVDKIEEISKNSDDSSLSRISFDNVKISTCSGDDCGSFSTAAFVPVPQNASYDDDGGIGIWGVCLGILLAVGIIYLIAAASEDS